MSSTTAAPKLTARRGCLDTTSSVSVFTAIVSCQCQTATSPKYNGLRIHGVRNVGSIAATNVDSTRGCLGGQNCTSTLSLCFRMKIKDPQNIMYQVCIYKYFPNRSVSIYTLRSVLDRRKPQS